MDKLQPLITHRFWIITGVALILVLVGWQMGTGSISAEFDAKKSTIDAAVSGIPDGKSTPNDRWIEGLDKATKIEKASLDRAAKTLWDDQQRLMVWPAEMQREMSQYPYRDKNISLLLARRYRTIYYKAVASLWESLDPFEIPRFVRTGKGKIDAKPAAIPYIPENTWKDAPPGPVVMWDSVEDLWLLKCLFDSINEVNSGARLISDAPIRILSRVTLQGGTGTNMATAAAGSAGGMASGDYMCGEGGAQADYMGCGGDPGGTEGFGGGAGSGSGGFGVDVKLTQDVGDPGQAAGGGSFAGDCACGESCGSTGAADYTCGDPGAEGMAGGSYGTSGQQAKRYVDDKEDLPFKTRAFKLELVMHIDKVPYLLAALNNADWPIRILRVHQQSRSQEFATAAAAAGGMGGMMNGAEGYGSGSGFGAPSGGFGAPSGGFGAPSGGFGAPSGGFGAPSGGFGAPSGGFGTDPCGGFGNAGIPGRAATGTSVEEIKAKQKATNAQQIYQTAIEDPYLADVVVTGLITIYQPPTKDPESETDADSPSDENTETQPFETGTTEADTPTVAVPETTESGDPVPADTSSEPMNPGTIPLESGSNTEETEKTVPVPENTNSETSEGF